MNLPHLELTMNNKNNRLTFNDFRGACGSLQSFHSQAYSDK